MINERIASLRKIMLKEGLDAYIISGSDPHQSEYTAERWTTRRWITGFTGSAGLVVVTADKAGLWTDSRYFIQAEHELKGTEVDLFKVGLPGIQSHLEWLADILPAGSKVGSNVWTTSISCRDEMETYLSSMGLKYIGSNDLLDQIWTDRPGFPRNPVFQFDLKYTGRSRDEKLSDIRLWMEKRSVTWYLISSLQDIAWTMNLRGSDINYNPLFLSYLLVGNESCCLFINEGQISAELSELLESENIEIIDYKDLDSHILSLNPGIVNLNPVTTSIGVQKLFKDSWQKNYEKDVTSGLMAIKNETEIEASRNAMRKDGAAMVCFLKWLEEKWPKGELTEVTAAEKLADFRSRQDGFMGLSFAAIAGFNDHGAIIHYSADKESAYTLTSPGILLLDSGAHYLDGTSDITRVLKTGDVSADIIHDYTLVLKGHIDLATVRFPCGTKGFQLDILARKAMWDEGRNYGHGTGHGVGFFLNVHEGPQSISLKLIDVPISEGMITSNEPGLYMEGKYGIRIENLVLAVKWKPDSCKDFLEFETLSLCPLEIDLIDTSMLTANQINWVNTYHQRVYKELRPLLEEPERIWLKNKTRRI